MSELRIMEWQGKYRIESGRQDGDKWWADKIRRKTWDKESRQWVVEDKDRNLSLPLGDLANARHILADLANNIQGDPQATPPQPPTEDVPF